MRSERGRREAGLEPAAPHLNLSNELAGNGHCPCCRRFTGSNRICPYCDADCPELSARQILKRVSLVLAFGGLLVLALIILMRAAA